MKGRGNFWLKKLLEGRLVLMSFVWVNDGSDEEARWPGSQGGWPGGEGGSSNDAKGSGACGHHMSWRRWMHGSTGGGDRGSSSDYGGGVLAGATGAACGCWGGIRGLRSTRGGRSRGDGSIDEGEAQEAVAGSW
jgi:hypothetical protein